MSETETRQEAIPTRSKTAAYLWWITLFFGAHRFYLRKWKTALLYPVSLVVVLTFIEQITEDQLGYFGLAYLAMLLIDACLIPRWVRQRNEWFAEDFKVHPNRYLIPDSADIAPWARGHERNDHSSFLGSAFRVYFFYWFVPFLTGVAAAWLNSLELLIIPIVVLGTIGLINTLDRMLAHHPAVLEIPGVGPAIERVAEMRAHFWDHEPRIGSAVWGLFRHWKQFKPYWTLAVIVAVTIVIEGVITYESNNQFIDLTDTVEIVGITALLAGALILLNLVPITALSFHYSLSGKRTRLRFMTVGALIATLVGYTSSSFIQTRADGAGTNPSPISAWRLEKRMEHPDFREQLAVKADVFLWYYINEDFDADVMNEDFRNLLLGLAPNDESSAFEIVENDEWAAVLYHHSNGKCNLTVWGDEIDPALVPKYSLLAFVIKNTELVQRAKVDEFMNNPVYEDSDLLEMVNFVSSKHIFYSWDDFLSDYIVNPDCHSLLYD